MQYADLFQNISLGTIIIWSCAVGFLGGCIHKFLEKYRNYKNGFEKKDSTIAAHDEKIQSIDDSINEINESITNITQSIKDFNMLYDKREAKRLRREILKFSDRLRQGDIPSKDSFEDIFDCNQDYEALIAKTDTKNGYTKREMVFVNKRYDELYGKVEGE